MFQKLQSIVAAAILTTGASLYAYSEDTRKSADEVLHSGHSTFHYELTQVLALAAGYDYDSATRIALASNAVDTFPTEMNTQSCEEAIEKKVVNDGETLYILGTVRIQEDEGAETYLSANAEFFHWPRRGDVNVYSETYPVKEIDNDTCANFGVDCRHEVNAMESWAIAGDGLAFDDYEDIRIPCVAEAGSRYETVKAGSLVALGIYLHALGDSYSHQACMLQYGVRTHENSEDLVCDSRPWHLEEEYGENGDGSGEGLGTKYTRNSALAIYQALQTYNTHNTTVEITNSPTVDEINLEAFIYDFVGTDDSSVRSCIANAYTQNILEGKPVYSPVTSRECRR